MRPRRILFSAIAIALVALAAACGDAAESGTNEQAGSPPTDCPPDLPDCDDIVDGGDDPFTGSNADNIAAIATNDLAERLEIQAVEIEVLQVFEHDWSDACLGVHYPDQACAQVITPGFVVKLSAQGREYTYHTDAVDLVIATDFAEGATIEEVEVPKEVPDEEEPAPIEEGPY